MATAPIVWADSFGSQDSSPYITFSGAAFQVGAGRGGRNAVFLTGPFSGGTLGYAIAMAPRMILTAALNQGDPWTVGISGAFVQWSGGSIFASPDNGATRYYAAKPIPMVGYCSVSIAVTRDPAAGTIDVWINDNLVISQGGLNTTQTSLCYIQSQSLSICDLIIQSSTATSDTRLGDLAVSESVPTADGAHTDWTPSTGTSHYSLVDEAPPVDTSYVSGTAVGQRDTYVMSDIPASSIAVYGVVAKYRAAKTDAGTGAVAPVLRIGGVDYDGTGQNLGTSFTQYAQVYNVSPATGVAFTVAEVNGLEAGVKRTA